MKWKPWSATVRKKRPGNAGVETLCWHSESIPRRSAFPESSLDLVFAPPRLGHGSRLLDYMYAQLELSRPDPITRRISPRSADHMLTLPHLGGKDDRDGASLEANREQTIGPSSAPVCIFSKLI